MLRLCSILLPALAAMAQPQNQPQAMPVMPTGHGVIEGTVVDAATHEPLKKAQVTMGGPMQNPPTAFTDAAGRFVFRELPAGGYWLSASKSSYNQAQSSFGPDPNIQVSLGADETKKGVEIALVPGASIEGRVLNEDGLAVRNCSVTAVQSVYERGQRELRPTAQGPGTDDKGEYRISGVPPGRYYLFAHCNAVLPAPHPLMPRGDPRTPHETYVSQFYGGGLDPATANKLVVAAGASLQGIDFELRRQRAVMLSGSVSSPDPGAFPENAMVLLSPTNRLMRNLMQIAAGVNAQDRTFQIGPVIPGSYRLMAFGARDGRSSYGQRALEIGAPPSGPIELTLSAGADLKGSVQFDTDDHPSLENAQVLLAPLDSVGYMQAPQAEINKDGTFTMVGVVPGHWRLTVNAFGSYIKSLSLAGRQVSPYDFQISAGASGPLQASMGLKTADLSVSITGLPAGGQASVVIFPEDPDRLGAGLERVMTGGSRVTAGSIPPGRYRLLATDAPNPWTLLQRPDLLKAMEGSTQAVDVPEGGRLSVTVEMVSREELLRVLTEKEQ